MRDDEVVDSGGHRVIYKREHNSDRNTGNRDRLEHIRIHKDGGREKWEHDSRHGNGDREIVDNGGHKIVYSRQHGGSD